MAAKQNVAGSITEKKRPATVLQFLGVWICFSYWKGLIFDGAASERIMVSRALLIGAIFSGVMSSVVEKDNPTTRPYGFVGVFVGFVGLYLVMCYVENLREKVKFFASQHKEKILYVGFMIGGSYLVTKLCHIDVAGLLSMFFFTSSVMMYQFETNRLENFGLIDGLLILQGAMVGLNLKDKSSFIQILFFFLMLGTLVLRLYILPDADADPYQEHPHQEVAVPDADRNEYEPADREPVDVVTQKWDVDDKRMDGLTEDGGRLPHLSNGWCHPWLQLLKLLLPWGQAEPQWNHAAESSGTSTFDSYMSSTFSTMCSNLRRRNFNGDGGGKSNDSTNAGNGVGGRK